MCYTWARSGSHPPLHILPGEVGHEQGDHFGLCARLAIGRWWLRHCRQSIPVAHQNGTIKSGGYSSDCRVAASGKRVCGGISVGATLRLGSGAVDPEVRLVVPAAAGSSPGRFRSNGHC